jgi:hypothetical protein
LCIVTAAAVIECGRALSDHRSQHIDSLKTREVIGIGFDVDQEIVGLSRIVAE